jgi:predicted nucleotidyltransferase component of viral defense system
MITKQELMDFSSAVNLAPSIVEKDYVLGWILAGIANAKELLPNWVFKGGTCLKKCYFETYRFSEDLDFTLVDKEQLSEEFLTENFIQIAQWTYEQVGIEIPSSTIRFELYTNKAGKTSVEGRVGYIGPLRRQGNPARIKLDLTADEILVMSPELREVHHPYTDKPKKGIKINSYNFPEIFAEKIRALSERARPRDLYDVIHLYRYMQVEADPFPILNVLKKKCEFKDISVPTMTHIENHKNRGEMEAEWENMLGHQLPMLPPLENFWQELPILFSWLHSEKNKA